MSDEQKNPNSVKPMGMLISVGIAIGTAIGAAQMRKNQFLC
jgi:hypothetical protein